MADDDLLDLGAQPLEGGDERLNPGLLTHRALLSRNPTCHSIESRQAMAWPPSSRRLGLILLDDRSKLPANWGPRRRRRITPKFAARPRTCLAIRQWARRC